MKNSVFYQIKSKVVVCVKGNNIERFIHRLVSNKIEILKLKYVKYNEVNITIYKKDYDDLIKLKTVYDVSIIDEKGLIKLKKILIKKLFFSPSKLACVIKIFILLFL